MYILNCGHWATEHLNEMFYMWWHCGKLKWSCRAALQVLLHILNVHAISTVEGYLGGKIYLNHQSVVGFHSRQLINWYNNNKKYCHVCSCTRRVNQRLLNVSLIPTASITWISLGINKVSIYLSIYIHNLYPVSELVRLFDVKQWSSTHSRTHSHRIVCSRCPNHQRRLKLNAICLCEFYKGDWSLGHCKPVKREEILQWGACVLSVQIFRRCHYSLKHRTVCGTFCSVKVLHCLLNSLSCLCLTTFSTVLIMELPHHLSPIT